MPGTCVLALDLGTTAFKAAAVADGALVGRVCTAPYALDYDGGRVTCDPERYVRCALKALRGAARAATEGGLAVRGIGISSQAQTFVALDARGEPLAPAIVWTDTGGSGEVAAATAALPDFARTSGFTQPSPLQFLPKLMRLRREGCRAARYLLLNEWIAYRLTGEAFGDATNQGMGGLCDIARLAWSPEALALAGIIPDNLAAVASAGQLRAPLSPGACRALGLPPVPVVSCGNDQSCAAIGAGIEDAGDLFCNFGTALVAYTLRHEPAAPSSTDQIAGVSPLARRWFLLAVESECGNLVEGLANLLYPRGGVGRMLDEALAIEPPGADLPQVTPVGDGRLDIRALHSDCTRAELARALLEHYSTRFGELLAGPAQGAPHTAITAPPGLGAGGPDPGARHCFAGGGMSRSAAWLRFLGERHGITLTPTAGEHPGLIGVAKIMERAGI